MAEVDVYGYLARLGLSDPGPPSVAGLRALHRAQVERVAYENLDIHLGRVHSIDPVDSFHRVVAGRGGYCFHCNGAFGLLLSALGYWVRWHRGGVQGREDPRPVGADVLRGKVLTRVPGGAARELTTAADWYGALADIFGLVLPAEDRAPLWRRVSAAHDAWLARR